MRDILFVEDLDDAMLFAQANVPAVCDRAFNIGGGPENSISLLELVALIATVQGELPLVHFDAWRAADQRFYVSDTRRFGCDRMETARRGRRGRSSSSPVVDRPSGRGGRAPRQNPGGAGRDGELIVVKVPERATVG